MTLFEVVSILFGFLGMCMSIMAMMIAFWNAKSASRQAVATESQGIMVRLHELETLYAARVTDLTQKYETVEMQSNLYKLHIQRCEEALARLANHPLSTLQHPNPMEG